MTFISSYLGVVNVVGGSGFVGLVVIFFVVPFSYMILFTLIANLDSMDSCVAIRRGIFIIATVALIVAAILFSGNIEDANGINSHGSNNSSLHQYESVDSHNDTGVITSIDRSLIASKYHWGLVSFLLVPGIFIVFGGAASLIAGVVIK